MMRRRRCKKAGLSQIIKKIAKISDFVQVVYTVAKLLLSEEGDTNERNTEF